MIGFYGKSIAQGRLGAGHCGKARFNPNHLAGIDLTLCGARLHYIAAWIGV